MKFFQQALIENPGLPSSIRAMSHAQNASAGFALRTYRDRNLKKKSGRLDYPAIEPPRGALRGGGRHRNAIGNNSNSTLRKFLKFFPELD
nr:hypothetical protein [uncultured Methanoregula sp.]